MKIMPWTRRKPGIKCLIGDNLSLCLSKSLTSKLFFNTKCNTFLSVIRCLIFSTYFNNMGEISCTDYKAKQPSRNSLDQFKFSRLGTQTSVQVLKNVELLL